MDEGSPAFGETPMDESTAPDQAPSIEALAAKVEQDASDAPSNTNGASPC